jgi:hypothetical protein
MKFSDSAANTAARARANHTGTQAASTISDFNEAVDDRVAALVVAGEGVTVAYDDVAGTLTFSASGGASLPADYISGLQMEWVGAASLKVKSGSACLSDGTLLELAADVTKASLSLSASSWYHVYLYDNAGTVDVEIVATAPAAPYLGTARAKTGAASRRYLGSVRTKASGDGGGMLKFLHTLDTVRYLEEGYLFGLRIYNTALTTVETDMDCSAVVPVTSRLALAKLVNQSATAGRIIGVGSPDDNIAGGSPHYGIFNLDPGQALFVEVELSAAQIFTAWFQSTGGDNFLCDVSAYRFER